MTDCIFCKIIEGEIPSAKVYEDDFCLAFLDTSQATPGHTLLIPKQHVADLFDYDDQLAAELFKRVPRIIQGMKKAWPQMQGLNLVNNNGELAYQTVFHSHLHLIPRFDRADGFKLEFANNQDTYSQEDFQALAQELRQAIDQEEV